MTVDGASVIPAITVPSMPSRSSSTRRDRSSPASTARPTCRISADSDRQFRQRSRPRAARRQPVQGNHRVRPANVGVPGDPPGFATIQQGYLEASNVDPVKEITELISAQRAYEMNSKVIQAADDMASVVSKNIR